MITATMLIQKVDHDIGRNCFPKATQKEKHMQVNEIRIQGDMNLSKKTTVASR
jgi:hypothetical protein